MDSRDRDGFDAGRVIRLVRESHISDKPRIQKLLRIATRTENPNTRRTVAKMIAAYAAEYEVFPFEPEPRRNGIRVGETPQHDVVEVKHRELTQHLLAVGQTGSGKTTFFYNLMEQLEVPWWAFDLKRDYRHLINEMEVLVLPWEELRFNPLQPPEGVSPERWVQVFADVFGHSASLLSGSKNFLMKKVVELYRQYGVLDGEETYPSLHDLRDYIQDENINYARKTANYRDTVLNRLDAVSLTAQTTFECSKGYSLPDLLQRNVVFEFDGLGRDLQNFLMEMLFAAVFEYRLAQGDRGSGLEHVFFLDEGKRVFSVYKERQDASGIPEIDDLTAKMREFGEGLVVADQEPAKLTDSIKANTYTKVLLPMSDHDQFRTVADSMDLHRRQREIAQQLQTGEAVIRIGNDDPLPVMLDDFEIVKTVTDDELCEQQSAEWRGLSYEPPVETPSFGTFSDGRTGSSSPSRGRYQSSAAGGALGDDALRFLRDVAEHPFKKHTERYGEFASRYRAEKAKNHLLEKELVEEHSTVHESGQRKLLALTEKGRMRLAEEGVDVEHRGRGGVVHRYWQHRIHDLARDAGHEAVIEDADADIAIQTDDKQIAVELAMYNKQREADHVTDRLDSGFDEVWIVCRNDGVRDGIRKRVVDAGVPLDRILFQLFRDYIGEETPLS